MPKIRLGQRKFNLPESRALRLVMGVLLIIGGILSSTFLTLLIVPVAYTLMADLYLWTNRTIAWIRLRFRRGGAPAE